MKYVSVDSGLIENHHLYAVDIDTWLFLDYDLINDEYKVIADIKKSDEQVLCWVEKIIHYEYSFFLIIRNSKQIVEVEEGGQVTYYSLDNCFEKNNVFINIDASVIEDKIYILPGTDNGAITVFDLNNKRFIKEISFSKLLDGIYSCHSGRIVNYIHNETDTNVRFCIEGTGFFAELSIKDLRIINSVSRDDFVFWRVSGCWEQTIVIQKDSYCFFSIDSEKGLDDMYCVVEHKEDDEDFVGYRDVFISRGKVVALPATMDCVDEYNIKGKWIRSISFPKESELHSEMRNYKGKFFAVIYVEDKAFYLPFATNGIVELDSISMNTSFHPMFINGMDLIKSKMRRKEKVMKETKDLTLKLFLNAV